MNTGTQYDDSAGAPGGAGAPAASTPPPTAAPAPTDTGGNLPILGPGGPTIANLQAAQDAQSLIGPPSVACPDPGDTGPQLYAGAYPTASSATSATPAQVNPQDGPGTWGVIASAVQGLDEAAFSFSKEVSVGVLVTDIVHTADVSVQQYGEPLRAGVEGLVAFAAYPAALAATSRFGEPLERIAVAGLVVGGKRLSSTE